MYNRKMKKIIVLFLISIISFSGVVRAEVETTENKAFMSPEEVREYMKYMDEPEEVQKAREAIFNGENKIVEQIDVSEYKDYFVDKKYSPNQKFRDATFYSNGTYRIWHNRDISFVYDKGELVYIVKKYYLKSKYDPSLEIYYYVNGNLKYARIQFVDNNEKSMPNICYNFDKNKNYIGYCEFLKFFSKDGKLILRSRPYIPFK